VLACLVPGAGHLYLRRVKRAVIIFTVITVTFWSGVAIGGATTVEPRYERWWFIAQMLTGVNGVVGWKIQDRVYDRLQEQLARDPQYIGYVERIRRTYGSYDPLAVQRSYLDKLQAKEGIALVAPTETVARAYSGVAGMLNLLCIFDALMLSLLGIRGEPSAGRAAAWQAKKGA